MKFSFGGLFGYFIQMLRLVTTPVYFPQNQKKYQNALTCLNVSENFGLVPGLYFRQSSTFAFDERIGY